MNVNSSHKWKCLSFEQYLKKKIELIYIFFILIYNLNYKLDYFINNHKILWI